MEESSFTIQSNDFKGNDIKITCEGINQQELTHFGGLDLYVAAARTLIESTQSAMSLPEKEGDHHINAKVIGLLINEIGDLVRYSYFNNYEGLEDMSSIELVKMFIDDIPQMPVVKSLLDKDDQLLKESDEEERKQEDKVWEQIISGIKNNKKEQ